MTNQASATSGRWSGRAAGGGDLWRPRAQGGASLQQLWGRRSRPAQGAGQGIGKSGRLRSPHLLPQPFEDPRYLVSQSDKLVFVSLFSKGTARV